MVIDFGGRGPGGVLPLTPDTRAKPEDSRRQ